MTRSTPQATTRKILPTVILDAILESVTEIEQEVELSNLPCAAQPAAAGEHTPRLEIIWTTPVDGRVPGVIDPNSHIIFAIGGVVAAGPYASDVGIDPACFDLDRPYAARQYSREVEHLVFLSVQADLSAVGYTSWPYRENVRRIFKIHKPVVTN